ncbi:GNAT family N-acetyltransferase [Maridesulfovibrio zosterae]|uniref:GNAT family N-acetyltransferase n=1 Tax=Maridesulfovibrio zosterae TaxID=82171 RepID=UPI00040F0AD2|nr:GNAT family N-acetyltransferase [Maridesulfovibrio zosterae]
MNIQIQEMHLHEVGNAVDFILNIFDQCVANSFSEEGSNEFRKYTNNKAMLERFSSGALFFTAKISGKLVGIAEIRNYRHLGLLFVDPDFQKQGIGKVLIDKIVFECVKHGRGSVITVNSSLNALDFYQKMGFIVQDEEKVMNGIRFIPMSLLIHEKNSNLGL